MKFSFPNTNAEGSTYITFGFRRIAGHILNGSLLFFLYLIEAFMLGRYIDNSCCKIWHSNLQGAKILEVRNADPCEEYNFCQAVGKCNLTKCTIFPINYIRNYSQYDLPIVRWPSVVCHSSLSSGSVRKFAAHNVINSHEINYYLSIKSFWIMCMDRISQKL